MEIRFKIKNIFIIIIYCLLFYNMYFFGFFTLNQNLELNVNYSLFFKILWLLAWISFIILIMILGILTITLIIWITKLKFWKKTHTLTLFKKKNYEN